MSVTKNWGLSLSDDTNICLDIKEKSEKFWNTKILSLSRSMNLEVAQEGELLLIWVPRLLFSASFHFNGIKKNRLFRLNFLVLWNV